MAGTISSRALAMLGLVALAAPFAAAEQPGSRTLLKPAAEMTVRPATITNSWICASGVTLDVQPVSFDDKAAPTAWVMLYHQNGKVVASERVTEYEAMALPAYDCDTPNSRSAQSREVRRQDKPAFIG